MTEPDEALLWAREERVKFWEKAPGVRDADRSAHINNARSGASDGDLEEAVTGRLHWLDGNRAGAAGSRYYIKALEARVKKLEACAAEQDRHNGVGAGMVIAAALIVRVWGQTVEAEEILNAAGIVSFDDLRKCEVDAYDVWPLRPVLRRILGRPALLGLAKYRGEA